MGDLKPCPFCGSKAIRWATLEDGLPTRHIFCSNSVTCGAELTIPDGETKDAVEAWNHRPAPTGEPVAWQKRRKWPAPLDKPGAIPQWQQCSSREATDYFEREYSCEYRGLYAHPDPRVAELEAQVADLLALREATVKAITEDAATIAALKAAGDGLVEYVDHLQPCAIAKWFKGTDPAICNGPVPACTCGLTEDLAAWEALTND